MEENREQETVKEQEKPKKHGFKAGVFTGILSTAAVVLVAGTVLAIHGNISVKETAAASENTQTVLDDATLSKLNELIGKINLNYYEDVDVSDLQEGLYSGLLEGLNDPYSAYYTADEYKELLEQTRGNFYGIGARLSQDKDSMQVTITKVYEDTPAEKAGLEAGDVIVKVDDIDATSMELSDLVQHIRGEEGTTVHLENYRAGESDYLEYDIERAKVNYETVAGQMLDGGIGYIYVSEFGEDTANQFEKTIADLESQGMKAMIVDLRDNGGGMITTVVQMLDDILPEGLLVYTEDKYGNRQEFKSSGDTSLDYPMAVLVNGNSASASEIFAGAIRDYDYGTLIGTTTYGKGVVQNVILLPEGDAVKLTIAKYYTPKGENIQGTGIDPDITLDYEYTGDVNADFDIYNDNQVAKAIEVLEGEMNQ